MFNIEQYYSKTSEPILHTNWWVGEYDYDPARIV